MNSAEFPEPETAEAEDATPECCCCGTKVGLHKDGWYGYRCDSDDCLVF